MVRFFDYRPRYRALKSEIDEAIGRVLSSGRLILGPEVEAFEREFASNCGSMPSGSARKDMPSERKLSAGDFNQLVISSKNRATLHL